MNNPKVMLKEQENVKYIVKYGYWNDDVAKFEKLEEATAFAATILKATPLSGRELEEGRKIIHFGVEFTPVVRKEEEQDA